MSEKLELKKGEYIDHYERNGEDINLYLVLEDGEYYGTLQKVEDIEND
jgi:hypothetical protein